jgi:hypothetical protein
VTYEVRPSDRAFTRFLTTVTPGRAHRERQNLAGLIDQDFRAQLVQLCHHLTIASYPIRLLQISNRFADRDVVTMHELSVMKADREIQKLREWRDDVTFAPEQRSINKIERK